MKSTKNSYNNLERRSENREENGIASSSYRHRKRELDIEDAKKQIDEFLKKGKFKDNE